MSKTPCAVNDCLGHNDSTSCITIDKRGTREYCFSHWEWICMLFNKVATCARSEKTSKCARNHLAEVSKDDINSDTIKFVDRYYDLCPAHIRVYEGLLDIWMW